ncbi:hypothetical protein HDF16_001609 [Granulicella aggregans]|uniref:Uncharacterized protein n=1 Tax=Granulicella aggregans TaxID=474949 RepID=A0A7W7ZC76_9BACT|nr:hypothetical protein [Granulicella aggregans]MBB5056924.1 hypothetical protein [Granulicella aggregans]
MSEIETGAVGTSRERKSYWSQLLNEKPDRHIELLLALVIAGFSGTQLFTSWKNNNSTTTQTNQLIEAAKISARAAERNAQAATDFSASAQSINKGIDEAVARLDRQALATKETALATQGEVRATVYGSDAARDSLHIAERAYVYSVFDPNGLFPCTDSPKGQNQSCARVVYKNFGQTPAADIVVSGVIQTGKQSIRVSNLSACKGSKISGALGKDASDECFIHAPPESREIAAMLSTASMPGSGYVVQGNIHYSDIFGAAHDVAFCNTYPFARTLTAGPSQCKPEIQK